MSKRRHSFDGAHVRETPRAKRRLNNWLPAEPLFRKEQEEDVNKDQGSLPPSPPISGSVLRKPLAVKSRSGCSQQIRQSNRRDNTQDIVNQAETCEAVRWWVLYGTWPSNFESMPPRHNYKRQKVFGTLGSDGSGQRSYSESRRNGEVPEQYSAAYEKYILGKGLYMNFSLGREHLANGMEEFCANLQKTRHGSFDHPPELDDAMGFLSEYTSRNEGIIARDITQLIIPPIYRLRRDGVENVEHIIDEVNVDWREHCVIAGPRPRPDLAIGISSSAFSQSELEKLRLYGGWAQLTENMCFPFLMCEVKCGREGLDRADRQNMHSCSIAVKALLQLRNAVNKQQQQQQQQQQQPDPHQSDHHQQPAQQQPSPHEPEHHQQPAQQQLEPQQSDHHGQPELHQQPVPKVDFLSGRVLVFSIAHDHQDARLYGHFGKNGDDDECTWTFHRYLIAKFDLMRGGLLELHHFVRNLFKFYSPGFVEKIKCYLDALPEPSSLSFGTSRIGLNDKEYSVVGTSVDEPASSTSGREIAKLVAQMEQQGKESREQLEQERRESKEQINLLLRELSEQRQENQKQRQENQKEKEDQRRENQKLIELIGKITTK